MEKLDPRSDTHIDIPDANASVHTCDSGRAVLSTLQVSDTFMLASWHFNLCHGQPPPKRTQDSKGKTVHPLTRRLGVTKCPRNSSRDWWRGLHGGPDPSTALRSKHFVCYIVSIFEF